MLVEIPTIRTLDKLTEQERREEDFWLTACEVWHQLKPIHEPWIAKICRNIKITLVEGPDGKFIYEGKRVKEIVYEFTAGTDKDLMSKLMLIFGCFITSAEKKEAKKNLKKIRWNI